MLKRVNLDNRIAELDFLKGFAVIFMILNHLIFDFGQIFFYEFQGTALESFAVLCSKAHTNAIFKFLTFALCSEIFITVSGVVSSFAKRTFREGIILAVIAAVITAASLAVEIAFKMRVTIWFGIFHLLAICMLISPLIKKIPNAYLLPIAAVALAMGLCFHSVTINNTAFKFLALFNFKCAGFHSADYYPIIPHLAFYLFGAFIGRTVYREPKTKLPLTAKKAFKPLRFLGAYSFETYILHQPILIGLIYVLTLII